MLDGAFGIAVLCYCLVALVGLLLRSDMAWYTGLSALGGMALIACLTNIEQGRPYLLWAGTAAGVVIVAAPWWKEMLGTIPRKERKMWAPWLLALALLYAALGRPAMNYSALTFSGVAFLYAGIVAWGAAGIEHLGTVTITVGIYVAMEGALGVKDAQAAKKVVAEDA